MSGRRRTLTQIRASLRWYLFSRRITRLKPDPSPWPIALSTGDLEGSGESVEVPMRSLPSLMEELGHDRIDLMKPAVEGMEFELLESINPSELGVRVLLVEFTWSRPVAAALAATEALRAQGYRPVFRHLGDVTFVHKAAVESSRLQEVVGQ